MLNREVEKSIEKMFKIAHDKRHEFVTVEHLLLTITEHTSVVDTLENCNVDIPVLQYELENCIEEYTPVLPTGDTRDVQPTLGFNRVLQRAVYSAQTSRQGEVSADGVLVAIFGEQESHAVYYLSRQKLTRLDLVNYISHGIRKDDEMDFDDFVVPDDNADASEDTDVTPEKKTRQPLQKYAINLNLQAEAGKIDPLIGRDEEVERTIQILCRRRKNNPLLVGEAGVGKTAIAEGLARKIYNLEVPEVLSDAVIYSLDLGSLLAGTKYRGDFEKRLKSILAQIKKDPHTILFIDEIHTIIGAGSTTGGTMDASNLIKPALSTGDLRCIGSTTFQEYHSIFEKDHALARRFQKIDINEPSVNETFQILKGLKSRFEAHHGVKYTNPALKTASELAARYINDRYLPDKAIDVMDEAGASRQLQPIATRKKTISVKDIEIIIAKIARIPPKAVSTSDMKILRHLDRDLKMVVFGQEKAIDQLTDAIKMARSGLRDEEKTIGSFLFVGPTGVGKTEVSKQLSNRLGIKLLRFDMSEYMERHTVSRLIGAPPGYVGYDEGGLLTDAINKCPHAVLLLDEIEKAHPDLFNILLQIMDHGTLTDANGRKVDFRNIILIMTSNAGAEQFSRSSMGFTKQNHSTDVMKVVKNIFSPEFRNRLDTTIQFNSLKPPVIASIVDKFLIQLESKLEQKKITLIINDKARRWIAKKGYDPLMGARPMARVIQEYIKKPLANEILFGELQDGGRVRVSASKKKLTLDFETEQVPA